MRGALFPLPLPRAPGWIGCSRSPARLLALLFAGDLRAVRLPTGIWLSLLLSGRLARQCFPSSTERAEKRLQSATTSECRNRGQFVEFDTRRLVYGHWESFP